MFTKTNLIILRGVSPTDLIRRKAQFLHKRPTEQASLYTPMPTVFENPETWPDSSNLRCWSCSLLFKDYPKFAPRNPRGSISAGGNFRCEVVGITCSWSCSVRYVLDKFPLREQADAIDLICVIESMFSGAPRKTRINPSPDKTVRAEYCGIGGMTVDEYRQAVEEAGDQDFVEYKFDSWRPNY